MKSVECLKLQHLISFLFIPLFGATTSSTPFANFPNTGISAGKVDASGNIYLAGTVGTNGMPDSFDVFVAKLSPDGSKVFYSTKFGGSKSDAAVALDIDSTGAAYVFGQTQSTDFPVTPGALQATMLADSNQGFVAKLDANGKIAYATLLGDSSDIYPNSIGIVVDAAGEAIVSGQTIGTDFPNTPGAPFTSQDMNTVFLAKLNATGTKLLAAVRGIGGGIVADEQGSIYVAGTTGPGPTAIPVTQGAFQSTFQGHLCSGTGQMALGCSYQYVTKLNAGLTQIIYSTYIAGSWGASPLAVGVDAQGNALLAGITNSPDYPTTPNAFQPYYIADAPPSPDTCLFGCVVAPPASGYVTKLNATGTGLIFSTFFSGTQTDTIEFAAFTNDGIYISGQASSPDLPGFDGVPAQCMPQTYETRLSADGMAVSTTRIINGSPLLYDSVLGKLLVRTNYGLITLDPDSAPTPIACIVDAADLRSVTSVAPGELLSIFGAHFVNQIQFQQPGSFATTLGGVILTVNGLASPLLYVSPQQINVQVPFEIDGAAQANLALISSDVNVSDSRTLSVTARNPVAFLDTSLPVSAVLANCPVNGDINESGPPPVALNSDGSRNSCQNPAAEGSIISIFLAGLGKTVPAQVTGSISGSPGTTLNLPITLDNPLNATVVSATAAPGSIAGVWRVDLRMPTDESGAIAISLFADSIPVRDNNLIIWVQ